MIFQSLFEKKLNIKDKPAFTLIEVITVLLVISLGMVGTLSLISQNIRSQSINEKTMVAYQLAQEGVELIRNLRDTNVNIGGGWLGYIATDGDYLMDYTDSTPLRWSSEPTELQIDENGMYRYNVVGGVGSGFSRIINIMSTPEGHQDFITVTSNVSWQDHGKDYIYSLETQLYNWR